MEKCNSLTGTIGAFDLFNSRYSLITEVKKWGVYFVHKILYTYFTLKGIEITHTNQWGIMIHTLPKYLLGSNY